MGVLVKWRMVQSKLRNLQPKGYKVGEEKDWQCIEKKSGFDKMIGWSSLATWNLIIMGKCGKNKDSRTHAMHFYGKISSRYTLLQLDRYSVLFCCCCLTASG